MAKDKGDGMANEGPFFVEGYKEVILAKQARKWKQMYLSRKGGVQPISVFEEILDEYFPDKCEASRMVSAILLLTTVYSDRLIREAQNRRLHNALSKENDGAFSICIEHHQNSAHSATSLHSPKTGTNIIDRMC